MRIFSLIQLLMALFGFGIYFYFIEPMIKENIWLKFLIFGIVFYTLSYFSRKFEGHFNFWERRIDNTLSIWIVFGILLIPLFFDVL
ncbi:hypothetical protein [Psychrobacillus antarcticus]|uniref:hypothetical protein n=1 Tax=Psychrobacillus antarcticus TaxID=2879115 RepID=UPI0024077B77|nr:hypothetical protein [Psychrobacillus antarcticus]